MTLNKIIALMIAAVLVAVAPIAHSQVSGPSGAGGASVSASNPEACRAVIQRSAARTLLCFFSCC